MIQQKQDKRSNVIFIFNRNEQLRAIFSAIDDGNNRVFNKNV